MFNLRKSEKHLKNQNIQLLNHLEEALKIMAETKCPYFIIEGYGAIYMDKKYIKRNGLKIDEEEMKRIKSLNSKEVNEFVDDRIKSLANELEKLCAMASSVKLKKEVIEEKPIKVGKTLSDLLGEEPKKELDIKLEKPNESIDVIPNITKDQAIEQVIKGQKSKDWGMISNINKYKAKSKIEESYKSEDDK